jgi:transcriptional regulator with XRE-family HTH domain
MKWLTFDRIVGSNIRKRRKALGLTQEQLAEMLGMTFQQVQKYERGRISLRLYRAVVLSGIFGCSVEALCAAS